MKHILVTGFDGLVGGAVAHHFCAGGFLVTGITRRPDRESSQNILLDLSRPNLVMDDIPAVDAVVHAAAVIPRKNTPNSQENADLTRTIDQNVAGFCHQRKIPSLYFSSCPLYDLTDPAEKFETSALNPSSPYHTAKAEGEQIFLSLRNAVVARLSSPYGLHSAPETVLQLFLSKAAKGESITLWGDGEREQDFIHVDDVARFAEYALLSGLSGIYNLAYGSPVTMKKLAELVIKLAGSGGIIMNNKPDPAARTYARYSIQKAADLLQWRPEVALEDGLREILKAQSA